MKRRRFFTPLEVSSHNTDADLWVSFLGRVCDLTPLIEEHRGDVLLLPILESAGRDISRWFDPDTRDVLQYVDPLTNCVRYYTPRGRFLHVPPTGPRSDWDTEQRLQVCSEETLLEVQQRYLNYNAHAGSYTWTHSGGGALDMSRTLVENNVPDTEHELQDLRLDAEHCPPAILVHYNDDLTEG
ncbi:hypothetical protein PBY51_005695 [Eleginops maclovinus]|uniref:Cytochrome b5 domain-containing protein 1 n=1 Tax=Eleginops maclovinus TaxID=56733 RepID=A0AAN7WSG6_ELEMC|nr:hypothetical protein PBY51_005695 [Eleginops maclovinus]